MNDLFPLGTIEISPSAAAVLAQLGLSAEDFINRHSMGDWGDVDDRRRIRNTFAITQRRTVRSRYLLNDEMALRVVTNGNWGVTVVLLDHEITTETIGVQAGYDLWSQIYDKQKNPLIAVEAPHVERILDGINVATALDAATGTGRHALSLARRGIQVTAVDQSAKMLQQAIAKAQAEDLNVRFEQATLEDGLPFLTQPFDLVICALALCHVQNLEHAFQTFNRMLNSGGHLLVTDFHPDVIEFGWETSFHSPSTAYSLPTMNHTRQSYVDAAETAGFSIIQLLDIPVKEVPEGYIFPEHIDTAGERELCLILHAQK